jgi:hypothetical protein
MRQAASDRDKATRAARRMRWLAALTGLAALVWFLVRVIPKPARAAYPCQRAAAPLAGGFLAWLAGLAGARLLHRRARALGWRYGALLSLPALALYLLWWPPGAAFQAGAQERFAPSDPPNQPMGTGQGIHPGRVVWVYQPDAARWDGQTGNWWDDANTDPKLVAAMLSDGLRGLTGAKTDRQAWDALFRYFNRTHGGGNAGYRPGEKIAVKINANQDRGREWKPGAGMHSPQMICALLEQLVGTAGVAARDITIYDASRGIGDPIYQKVKARPEFQEVRFVVSPSAAREGRLAAEPDLEHPVRFSQPGLPAAYLPRALTEARYLINLALLRAHTLFGVTLAAKNHFGSTYFPDRGGWTPQPLHETGARGRPMGSYNCLVDLNGHRQVGGKTLLYLLEGLYPAEHQQGGVVRFLSFGDRWASSLLLSQDPVAIDSVGLDILRSEPRAGQVRGNPDNYLHEAALGPRPPSGIRYDPEGDGAPLAGLGVHEHWNNPRDRRYSRNLGKSEGIELITLGKPLPGPAEAASSGEAAR